eukprot:CAMPEP_0119109050 /NCGR_PEP_ID=MMETSP1180-20130426/16975_1 /TAXON_ID=3052 ORGANISM="Chlamydomonas cf sp, Strain CCMP681" /NCGR_SAMPLE_ID=MMETSP1180 /ASSEMBLY_ACC=CAM_ASM_000741 /LENGTH=107 /DNA_ID=CAMNT_0007094751 /DNA_START=91 /DNA_END=414 /DNA_ORIENTATION=+
MRTTIRGRVARAGAADDKETQRPAEPPHIKAFREKTSDLIPSIAPPVSGLPGSPSRDGTWGVREHSGFEEQEAADYEARLAAALAREQALRGGSDSGRAGMSSDDEG